MARGKCHRHKMSLEKTRLGLPERGLKESCCPLWEGPIYCSLVFRVAAPQRCLEELSFVPEQGCPDSCSLFLALPPHPTLPTHSCHKHTGTHPTPGHAKGSSGLEALLLPLPLPLVFYSSPLTLLFECWPSLAILGILR